MSIQSKRGRSSAIVAAIAASIGFSASTFAATVVNDTWLDGTDSDPAAPVYSENGVDADTDGDIESVWFQGGGGTLDPAGPGGPLVGTMAPGGSSSWTTYFTPEGSEVALNNAGDKLRLTWVFTTGDVNATNTSQNLRIALVDSPSGSRVTSSGAPGSATYAGYGIFGNMGETLGHSNSFELVERSAPGTASALLSSSGSWEDDNLAANDGSSGDPGYTDNTQYTFVMELTRNAANGIDISSTMSGGTLDGDGTLSVSATDADPAGFIFDTFALRPSTPESTATVFNTNRLTVEFEPIPEPSSLALLGLAGLALGRRRARQA